jgi:hypothetical protein
MTTKEQQKKYWSLRDLTQRCPAKVNGEKITGATRRILDLHRLPLRWQHRLHLCGPDSADAGSQVQQGDAR